ncbi:MAG TPA: M28 family peptidase [Vicinamibacterales bacterium]|nr:M28 family peptidase [Vicinamibacterales bacterium]
MRRIVFLVLFGFIAAASAIAIAQSPASSSSSTAAWFGVALPPGLGDPHRAIIDVSAAKPAPAIVPAGEEKNHELEGAAVHKHLEAIVGFSRADQARGEKAWGRITGFPGADATHQWVAEQFKAAGLKNVELQTYTASGPTWHPKSWEVRVMANAKAGAASRDVVLESAFPTSGSQLAAPVTAPLVYVGATTDAALPDVDVKGKVAVQRLHPQAGAFSERTGTTERARALAQKGAVAVLNVVEQAGNMHVRDFSNCGVPCFNLGTEDGKFLIGIIEKATAAGALPDLRVKVALDTEMLPALKGHNTIGTVVGRRTDEQVIVNAHADGWFDAAGDNGDGLAVLIALARHFAKPENQPERSLVFVASGGHHGGGMNGPGNLMQMNPGLKGPTVLVLNLEHIAQLYFRNDPFRVESAEQPMGWGVDTEAPYIQALAKRGMERYGFALRPNFGSSIAGDLGGYAPIGAPRAQAIHAGPLYHTSGDTIDTISTPGLERAARYYAYFVADVAKANRADLLAKK